MVCGSGVHCVISEQVWSETGSGRHNLHVGAVSRHRLGRVTKKKRLYDNMHAPFVALE